MPELIRRAARVCLSVMLFPLFWHIQHAPDASTRRVRFQLGSEFMSLWPFQLGIFAREVFYQKTLRRCGERPIIRMGSVFVHPEAELGANVLIGNHCVIGLASIGDRVMLANSVSILSGRYHHQRDELTGRLVDGKLERVTVAEGAWIGANAVVMADIGFMTIVGAGSVITKSVGNHSTVVGNPGKVITDSRINLVSYSPEKN